jgi:hypothetical protein
MGSSSPSGSSRTATPSGASRPRAVSRNSSAYLKVASSPTLDSTDAVTSALRTPGDFQRPRPLTIRWSTAAHAKNTSTGNGVHTM